MVFAYLITEKISQVYEVQRLGDICTMNLPRKTKYRDLYRAIGCRIVHIIYYYEKLDTPYIDNLNKMTNDIDGEFATKKSTK